MEISPKQVAELRAETGVGMMDCKRALVDAGGDFEEAKKILRKKGLAAAARKADRAASEGLVVARVTPKAAVLVEVNCETDFVARTADFREFAEGLADQIAAHDAFGETRSGDLVELDALPANDRTTETVADLLKQLIASTLQENIVIRRFARLVPRDGERFASYVHGNGRIGVVVGIRGGDLDLGKDLAMHVAASDPRFAGRSEVTSEMLETEREIARAQAAQAGKPANVVERIADGKVEKFYQESVLTEQAFVKDPEKTVGQIVVERGGKEALDLRFLRFKLGEAATRSEAKAEA
ncbi:MAG TPA: translation elongation factor Ts [Thermoanaerobaculia bacterium]|jgi:elongation factor Ts|nr:translation elongation factor Ts [Thermoanaerobaculia bacterium]